MYKGMWLFCHGSAKLILQMTRCILMWTVMPAMFSLALQAHFDATTSPSASPPPGFFVLPCSGTSSSGSLLIGLAGPLQCNNLTPSQSALLHAATLLHLVGTSCSDISHLCPASSCLMPWVVQRLLFQLRLQTRCQQFPWPGPVWCPHLYMSTGSTPED